MNKLTDLRNQIDEFKRLENQRDKKMEEVKFEADEQNKIAHWFGPPLNFMAREITKLVIESDLLSLLEEKDKEMRRALKALQYEPGTGEIPDTDLAELILETALTSSNNEGE